MKENVSAVLQGKSKALIAMLILSTSISIVDAENPTLVARADANLATMDVQHGCVAPDGDSASEDDGSGSSSGEPGALDADGIPNKEGIKATYDWLHGKYGMSGEFIAGILGNWIQESQINPMAMEMFAQPWTESQAKQAIPLDKSGKTGIGLGQWSFTRHTGLVQMAEAENTDWWNIEIQLKYMTDGDAAAPTLKKLALEASNSPSDAAKAFHDKWEISADDATVIAKRQAYAEKVWEYMKEEGMDGKKDTSKINKISGSVSGGTGDSPAASTDISSDEKVMTYCGEPKEESGGGAADWGGDGKGEHNYSNGQEWLPDKLPADLKKYALDPKSIGLGWKSSSGWTNPGGQCVHFSTSMFYALWEKNGKPNPDYAGASGGKAPHLTYNGVDSGKLAAYVYKGEIKKKPSKGAIWGVAEDHKTGQANSSAGHTGVVSHVFADGSILIVEQNWTQTGDNGGMPLTWNYRIISKEIANSGIFDYYSPEKEGYKPSSKIKTL